MAYNISIYRSKEFSKSYFQDFSNLRFRKGKTFLANPRIFKAAVSLFFPNFRGTTLASPKILQDTFPVLQGKISVVTITSNLWAKNQVETFVGKQHNPAVHEIISQNPQHAQLVEINVEYNPLKAFVQRLFFYRLRKDRPVESHGRYFIVRQGVTDQIRTAIGFVNSKVGYVYLVDADGKIRWAGSALAENGEADYLVTGLRRLVKELQTPTPATTAPVEGEAVAEPSTSSTPASAA